MERGRVYDFGDVTKVKKKKQHKKTGEKQVPEFSRSKKEKIVNRIITASIY